MLPYWPLPLKLRSLDAIHLVATQVIGDELRAVVTYDVRMTDAGRNLALRVETPR